MSCCCGEECCLDVVERSVVMERSDVMLLWRGVWSISEAARDRNGMFPSVFENKQDFLAV